MKKSRAILMIGAALAIGCVVYAQAVKDNNSSVGNGDMMKVNLNEPNAINPAMNNNQSFDRGNGHIKTDHPDKDFANKYNRTLFTGEKNDQNEKKK